MRFLEALFSGARAILTGVVEIARHAIRAVLADIDHSAVGHAFITLASGVRQGCFSSARNFAQEERALADKYRRDGRRSESDINRLSEIRCALELVKKKLDEMNARQAEAEINRAQEDLILVLLTDDDLSASSGLLASKRCSVCGGTMRIRQGDYNKKIRDFWWQCTAQTRVVCPTVKIDLAGEKSTILRKADPDLDGPSDVRRKLWMQPELIAKTHARLRVSLGDDDEQMVCPHHVLPMKLIQRNSSSGLMLDSYEYVCLGVTADGRACGHKVEVKTFAQVSALLRRRDGIGILDS
jgi:hypothetical protein